MLNRVLIHADQRLMANEGLDEAEPGTGQIAGSITAVIVRLVERAAGDDGLARLMALAGDERNPRELRKGSTWTSYNTAVALFRAGVEVTGEPGFPRHVGEEMLRQYAGSDVAEDRKSVV